MTVLDIFLSIIVNLFPLGLFAIPLIFLRKKMIGQIYKRFYYGLIIFFIVYWVLPSIFQFNFNELNAVDNSIDMGIGYLFGRSFSMLLLYAQYPFYLLPFIFIIAPFFSLILLIRKLKKESGTSLSEKLMELNYEFTKSPRDMITESLKKNDWNKEKEIMKAFIIVLPISLYLLTVILEISGVPADLLYINIEEGSSSLGWFIEILFVYLATFLFGFQLIKASKVSFKGRFIGEQIQSKFLNSLTEVGTPISVLSILLFIAQSIQRTNGLQSILLVIFFFAYFLMAAFIFIVMLKLFEPISILIFVKILNWWKIRQNKTYKANFTNVGIVAIYSIVASFISIVMIMIIQPVFTIIINSVPGLSEITITQFLDYSLATSSPTFEIALATDLLSIVSSVQTIIITLSLAFFFSRVIKNQSSNGISTIIYAATTLIITLILYFTINLQAPLGFVGDLAWTTSAPVKINTNIFGFDFYSMRTAFYNADLSSNTVLWILAFPFTILRPFVNFILWGATLGYNGKRFYTKTVSKEANFVERITFSNMKEFMSLEEFLQNPELLITAENVVFEKEEAEDLMKLYENVKQNRGLLIQELIDQFPNERDRLYTMLKYFTKKNYISWWIPEFSYKYERATLDGLYLLYSDGRDLLYYNFQKEKGIAVDPALVSGMFSAITSFIQETTRSSDLLRSIDSGEKKVLLEYSENFPIFIALFCSRETTEVRTALRDLLFEFQNRHKKVLGNWSGNMEYFEDDEKLVEKYFIDFF